MKKMTMITMVIMMLVMVTACSTNKVATEQTVAETSIEAIPETEDRTELNKKVFWDEEIIAEDGDIAIKEVEYSVGNGKHGYSFTQEYYICFGNKEILVPEKYVGDYPYYLAEVLKNNKDYVIVYMGSFKIIKYNYGNNNFENFLGAEPIWSTYNEDMDKFWWIDSNLNGHVFYVDTEKTTDIENVIGLTEEFPGFYVKDSRGVSTPNGNLLSVEEVSKDLLKKEGERIAEFDLGENDYRINEDGSIAFADTSYKITDAPKNAKVIKILYEGSYEKGYKDIGAVLLESDKLFLYDFKNDQKMKLAEDVMPRTISSSYNNVMWLDKDYCGHIIFDIYKSTENESVTNVLDTLSGSDYWNMFLTVPSDERLEEYESYRNYFIVEEK